MNIALQSKNGEQIHLLQLDDGEKGIQVVAATIDQKLATYDELSVTIALQEGEALDVGAGDTAVLIDGGEPREYIINEVIETDDEEHTLSFYADLSAVELTDEIVREEVAGKTNSHAQAVAHIMQHTRWQVFDHAENIHARTIDIEMRGKTVIEALTELAAFYGFEYDYVYTMDDTNNITHRVVNLRNQVGADREKRFEIDKDMESVSRTVNAEEIKTAIIAVGNELEDGTRIDLVGLEWKRTDGREVDKTKTADFLEIPEATKAYGRYDHATKRMRPRFLYAEFSAETQESLAIQALDELKRHALPTVTYEAQVVDLYREDMQAYRHEKVGLGDRVAIIDHDFMQTLAVSTRVVEFRRDLLDELNNEIVLGDARDYFPDDAKKSINEINRKLAEEKKEREKLEKKQADFEWEAMEERKWTIDKLKEFDDVQREIFNGLERAEEDDSGNVNYIRNGLSIPRSMSNQVAGMGIGWFYMPKEGVYRSHSPVMTFMIDSSMYSHKDYNNIITISGVIENALDADGNVSGITEISIELYRNDRDSGRTKHENIPLQNDGSFAVTVDRTEYSFLNPNELQVSVWDESKQTWAEWNYSVKTWDISKLKVEIGKNKTGYRLNENDQALFRSNGRHNENMASMSVGGGVVAWSEWRFGGSLGRSPIFTPVTIIDNSKIEISPLPYQWGVSESYELYDDKFSVLIPMDKAFENGKIYTVSFEFEHVSSVRSEDYGGISVKTADEEMHLGTTIAADQKYRKNKKTKLVHTFVARLVYPGYVNMGLTFEDFKYAPGEKIRIENLMIVEGIKNPTKFIANERDKNMQSNSGENLQSYASLLSNVEISENNKGIKLYDYQDLLGRVRNISVELPTIKDIRGGYLYTISFDFLRLAHVPLFLDFAYTLESGEISTVRYKMIGDGIFAGNQNIGEYEAFLTFPTPENAMDLTVSFSIPDREDYEQYKKERIYIIENIMVNFGIRKASFRFSDNDIMVNTTKWYDAAGAINNGTTFLDANMIDFEGFQLDANKIDFEGFQFDASKLVNLSIDDSHITVMDGAKITDASITNEKITDVDASKVKNLNESHIKDLSYKATKKYITESGEDKTNADGIVMIPLSSRLIGKADLSAGYQVFLQAYDRAQLFVPYRDELYFTVESDVTGKQTSFGWKVEALQKQE